MYSVSYYDRVLYYILFCIVIPHWDMHMLSFDCEIHLALHEAASAQQCS